MTAYPLGLLAALAAAPTTVAATASATTQAPIIAFPAPAVPPAPQPPRETRALLIDFVPGPVRCADAVVAPIALETPFPAARTGTPPSESQSVAFDFSIDANGRPVGIRTAPPSGRNSPFVFGSVDVVPALSASRFTAGHPRTDCRISVEARTIPVAQAPLPLAYRYLVSPHVRQSWEGRVFQRVHPADSDCIADGAPSVRLRAYPDFDAIPQASGTWSYAMTAFDIDKAGKPIRVKIAGSSGNAALDKASVAAVQASRFGPGARHGCTYPYFRRQKDPLPAPPMPDRASFEPAADRCPKRADGAMARLTFPPGFEARGIEGWAIIGYDIAPWGQRGNIRVIAAEPAAAFGDSARMIVQNARSTASETGASGCVEVVRFVMPKRGAPDTETAGD